MKYVLVLADGMADEKVPSLGDKTPLQYANLPTINSLAQRGEIGKVKTIPDGMSPGSDTANLSVMGYDPKVYHTGRSPLEAVSMGIDLADTDVTFRCNLVTLSEDDFYDEKVMLDNSAGEISSEEAAILIRYINEQLGSADISFYPGVSYRHAVVWKNGSEGFKLIPPHDILDRKITDYLPKEKEIDWVLSMMRKSYELLKDHPVNISRKEKGLKPANSIWIWGEGRKPRLDSFKNKYHLEGAVISAVDLVKGIGICAGLESIDVPGATGNIHTNFDGKAMAGIDALKRGKDYVYLHVEAPDECSHQGDCSGKIRSMEIIDEKIVKPIYDYLSSQGEPFKILILPDHPTPIAIKTHTSDPVPFVLYDSTKEIYNKDNAFDEIAAEKSGMFFDAGYKLADYFLDKK
ncbi:MAG: cofactor-independent phosphoglycerate mutase [Clostridiales bacterium]|nr:cofactor-independent phosphoglycerate mutase [Clostridiales bacterium]